LQRRGLALYLALTSASAAGVFILSALVWGIGQFGLAAGLAAMSTLVALSLLVRLHYNLLEPDRPAQA
jgi:hypothetical protein